MNTKSSIIKKALFIIIPLVLIAIVVIKLKSNKEITQRNVYQYDKEQTIHIQADTIQFENVNDEYNHSGTFEPNKESKISAEVQGKIISVLVDIGTYVHKGQTLIKLDDILLEEQLKVMNIQIENLNAENQIQIEANQIQTDGLQADVSRYKILSSADAIQGIQLEKSEIQLRVALNQRKALLQQSLIKNAKAQKAQIIQQINKTTIKAPFNGVVTAKLSEVGAFAAPGIPLLQITDITNLKFTINVPENDLRQFKLNQNYSISADAYPEITLNGKTTMIGSKANMGSSFPVQFTVNNTSDLKIKSGMFGKVNIKNDTQEKGIIILSSSIVGSENHAQVYLIKNGKAILQNIVISKKLQNKSIVSSGLNEGDVIVTNGFINLFDGANVIWD